MVEVSLPMPYALLKQIITHLKKKIACPFCKSHPVDASIFVLMTTLNPLNSNGNGLFFIICPQCFAQAFVMTEVSVLNPIIKQNEIRIKTKMASGVSINEILDMHNFLKTWQGDVTELFREL